MMMQTRRTTTTPSASRYVLFAKDFEPKTLEAIGEACGVSRVFVALAHGVALDDVYPNADTDDE